MNAFGKTTAEVIGKFHPLFAGLTFVAAARTDDENRFALTHVLVEKDPDNDLITRLVATDGRRLHVHTYDAGLFEDDILEHMLEPGLYEIIHKSKSLIVICKADIEASEYPNWKIIVPDGAYDDSYAIDWKRDTIHEQTTGKICIRTGSLFASEYLADACGVGCAKTKEIPVRYWQETPTSPIVIHHDLGMAIVMPLRFDDDEAEDEKEATATLPHLRIVADDENGTEVELELE